MQAALSLVAQVLNSRRSRDQSFTSDVSTFAQKNAPSRSRQGASFEVTNELETAKGSEYLVQESGQLCQKTREASAVEQVCNCT
jgi:hypothetical protein